MSMLYSIQGNIFPRLIITSSGVDTQVTSESVLIRFESASSNVCFYLLLLMTIHIGKCQVCCRVSSLGDFKECIVFILGFELCFKKINPSQQYWKAKLERLYSFGIQSGKITCGNGQI